MTPYAVQIALLEYVRGTGLFGLGRLFGVRRTPAGRDFFSFTLLCATIIALVAFSWSAGRGITENITQIMLGHVRGAGTPIWILNNVSRFNGWDEATLSVFANRGGFAADQKTDNALETSSSGLGQLSFFPVWETEMQDPLVMLPTQAAWPMSEGGAKTEFRGWVVDTDNPVWTAFASNVDDGQTVVLNLKLFREHFDYAAYRDAIVQVLPEPMTRELPATLADLQKLDSIYLLLPFNRDTKKMAISQRLVRFKVAWAENLPALQKISILLPYRAMSLAQAVFSNPALGLVFDADRNDLDKPFQILAGVSLVGIDRPAARKFLADGTATDKLSACLKVKASDASASRLVYTMNQIVPWPVAQQCIEQAGLKDYPGVLPSFVSFPEVKATGRMVDAPCAAISLDLYRLPNGTCAKKDDRISFLPFPGFRTGLVFVPPEQDIATVIGNIRQYRDKDGSVFLIAESYQDALARMDFTQKVIQYLTLAMAGLGVVLCGAVLFLQIRPMVTSRAAIYGLLLARGIRWRAIYAGLAAQIAFAIAIATAIAFVILSLIRFGLENSFAHSNAAMTARRDFGLLAPHLIPLPPGTNDSIWGWILSGIPSIAAGLAFSGASALLFAMAILRFLPLRGSTTPVELIVGQRATESKSKIRMKWTR